MQKNIDASYGEQATDLDEVTIREEIFKALRDQLKLEDIQRTVVKSRKSAYDWTQKATIRMFIAFTKKMLFVRRMDRLQITRANITKRALEMSRFLIHSERLH